MGSVTRWLYVHVNQTLTVVWTLFTVSLVVSFSGPHWLWAVCSGLAITLAILLVAGKHAESR